jgi:glycosyltransferase involved in cell wall biosynthesis
MGDINKPGRPARRLLLVSGLSLSRISSFVRQIRLLARGFRDAGVPVACAGMEADELRLAAGLEAAGGICERTAALEPARADAVIALGYPDQFPFLHDDELPSAFLWAQCSKPPALGALGSARPVALTPRTAELYHRAGYEDGADGIPVIPHAVDTTTFRPATPEEALHARRRTDIDGRPVFGAVGANNLRKRLDLLLEAFAAARRQLSSAVLVLKTDRVAAPGGYDLPELCRKHGVADGVRLLTDELDDGEMAQLYWSMDIFLHTAEWEGFGIPAAEAMACGVPVLTHDGQGPGELVPYPEHLVRDVEVVEDGGVVLRWVRPHALAQAACSLAEDARERRRMARVGRAHAVAEYSLPAVTRRWIDLVARAAR